MNDAPHARLQRLLGGDTLAALRQRLRRYHERIAPGESVGTTRLGRLTAQEHDTLSSLLGKPSRYASSMQIDIAAIDTTLREAGIALSLRDALVELDGPIIHTATARAETQTRWQSVVTSCRHAGLTRWLQSSTGSGVLKRLARQDIAIAAALCERADRVLQHLPATGIPRAQLAAGILGDAHALDDSETTATLILGAWRTAIQENEDPATSLREERIRDVWARAGVLVNELARPALFLNLPAQNTKGHAATPGEPGYASLRSLVRTPPAWAVAGRDVYVCENPNLLAIAADQLGERCAPMMCTDGMPAAAQRTLLFQLEQAGARLLYHGDFDWAGLHIANHVMRETRARPWRFSASDYEAAVRHAPSPGKKLARHPVAASWEAALMPAMQRHDLAIAEEAVAASLLQDLQR
jgi:uncharacterized protein (TIGR02679 family)